MIGNSKQVTENKYTRLKDLKLFTILLNINRVDENQTTQKHNKNYMVYESPFIRYIKNVGKKCLL